MNVSYGLGTSNYGTASDFPNNLALDLYGNFNCRHFEEDSVIG